VTSEGAASAGQGRVPGMRLSPTYRAEEQAVRAVRDIIADEFGWFFGVNPLPDYGIDAQAEVVTDDALVTGQWLAIQIKGGSSWFRNDAKDGWTFYDDSDHLAYWLGHSLPVIVVIVDPDGHAYWEQVTTSTARDTEQGFALKIPRSQPLSMASRDRLLEVAGRSKGLTASLPDLYEVLPPAATGPLQRAADIDRLAAARLAERLAGGGTTPGATAALVVATPPSWLVKSPAAQDLWLAVASYAAEYGLLRESGEAFALAADVPGPRSARARALAGTQLMGSDRDAARDLLLRARDEGETVFADVGLTALDLPEGDARPYDVPESLRDAPQGVIDADPFLLNFLAEAALRRRDYTRAVSLREQAVTASGDRDSTYRLALAGTLRRRAQSEPGSSGVDLRTALGYAQAAVAERRRWNGPSAEALGEVLDILTAASDTTAVITAALPESLAGTALEAEAAAAGVARRGAHAALASRDRQAYKVFMQFLPDGPYRRELQVQDDEAQGRPRTELVAAWTRLISDPADDAMTARCAAALARLGTWAPQADELRARSVLPEAEYETLKAVCRAEAGQPDLGIARLRELSDTSLLAAGELVLLLERIAGPGAAISEAEQQAARWQSPVLQVQYVELLGRHGRFPDAVAFIERAISDQSLPADVRVRLCSWYVTHQARQRSLAAAAATARLGLAVGEDVDLAWKLVTVLFSDGRLSEARQALDRYELEPGTDQEMRMWMQLHLGIPVSADAARVMIGLAGRLPDGEFRDAVIAMLIREAALAQRDGTFPPDLIAAIAELEAATRDRPRTGLRIDPGDDAALRAALEKRTPDRAAYQQLLTRVQGGTASMADIGNFVGQRYGTVLLHRPAGLLPAAHLEPGMRAAGEQAARSAVAAGSCVADLSSLHLLGLLTDDDRLRIRSAVPASSVIVARSAVDDALLTRDHTRNLSAATYTASLAPDGTIDRTTLTPAEQALLLTQAEALETAASSAQARQPTITTGTAADTIAVARESQLPLWCDDNSLRQKARIAGVAAFSLLDLITVLQADGATFDLSATYRRLAGQYVADLPLDAADITTLAAAYNWQPGPAHTALARPAWWAQHDAGWEDTWLQVATEARRHSAGALITITRAAITGALQHVRPGYATQRYQQIAVLALVACHDAAWPSPTGFLDELARQARDGLAPDPRYVLTALISHYEAAGSW
jgi:hypothetical protein